MITLSALVVWMVSGFLFYREQDRTTREMMSNTLWQNMRNFDSHIQFVTSTCYNIAFDPALVRYLRFARFGQLDAAEVLDVFFYLNKLIVNYEALNSNTDFFLYLNAPELLTHNRVRFVSLDEAPADILDSLREQDTATLILPPAEYSGRGPPGLSRQSYTVVQSVSGITPSKGLLALVVARIEAPIFHNIIGDITLDRDSYIYLHNEDAVFYLRRGNEELPVTALGELKAGSKNFARLGKSSYAVFQAKSALTGWELTALINRNSYLTVARRMAVIAFAVALLFALFSGFITARYFNRLACWLEELSGQMKLAAGGNYNLLAVSGTDQEIRAIQSSYNTMISTIKSLIEDHYQQQIKLQVAEFQALENQIKPHFLYNTLDVIKFRALRSGAPEVASNLEDMARYFRLVLARGRDSLTLLDETEHCRLYLKLYNFRHEAELVLETEIPEDTAFALLPRFMLQPLVENAVVHGIRPKPGRTGRIVISAFRKGKDLHIRVIDDGEGIPLEILTVLPEDGGEGFGLFNVHARIRLLYGPGYGLFFPWSGKGGTCAELRFPYKADESYPENDIDPAELCP